MAGIDWIELSICMDCAVAAANADFSGMDEETEQRVRAGLERTGHIVVGGEDDYDEFRKTPCDCCRTFLHGSRQVAWQERHATA